MESYLETKDLGILDMNFHYACHWKKWGETWHHHCRAFHLRVSTSSYKFLCQLIQMDFIFHCAYLGFRV